jgi:alginate O-acetyltransferase complex protein AlgI
MPYRSGSITEFWRRWHMTLSAWLRDYLYIPLGGNRRGAGRTLVNLMTVMVLGGLWHGASWSFVIWGAWHGIWLIGERLIYGKEASEVRSVPYRIVTLVAVLVGWVVFRADTVTGAWSVLGGMVGAHGFGLEATLSWKLATGSLVALAGGLLVSAVEPAVLRLVDTSPPKTSRSTINSAADVTTIAAPGRQAVAGIALSLLFVLSIVRLLASSYSPFLYFRF